MTAPVGERRVPGGEGRGKGGGRTSQHRQQALGLVREETCQSSGSLVKTA